MWKLFIADLKMVMRNRQYAFWSIMMPLMFTFIFGFFFGSDSKSGNIAIINNSNTELAQTLEKTLTDANLFNINSEITTPDEAKEQIQSNKLGAAIIIPENFGAMTQDAPREIKTIVDPGNSQVNAVLNGFLDKFVTNLTFQSAGIKEPMFKISEEKTNAKDLNYFDFVLAGILGMALMNSSIIGIAVGMSKYREDKILKRITTTPMKTWWFIVGETLSRLVMNFVQISIILLVGRYVFDAHIYGNIFVIFGLALLGAVLFQAIGFVIASFVKTTDAAQGAATALTMPMMFLGGVFFPIDTLPKWLYAGVQYLPIAPLLRMVRGVVLEGVSVFQNPANMAIVSIWIVVALGLSIWKFRLSDE